MSRLVLIVGLFALVAAGCNSRSGPPGGGARGSKADAARRQAEALAASAATGAAAELKAREALGRGSWAAKLAVVAAAVKESSTEPVAAQAPPKPTVQAVTTTKSAAGDSSRSASRSPIRELVWNQLDDKSEAEARADMLAVAQDTIERRLAELDPPVRYRPTANEVENEFLRRDGRYSKPLVEVTGDEARVKRVERMRKMYSDDYKSLYYAEGVVELTADQVRELRTRDRLADALQILGLVSVAAVAGWSFLRLDQWTRGHLTRSLAIAVVALAALAAAGLYLVR